MWNGHNARSTSMLRTMPCSNRRNVNAKTAITSMRKGITSKRGSLKSVSSVVGKGKQAETKEVMQFPLHCPILVTKENRKPEMIGRSPTPERVSEVGDPKRNYSALGSPKFNSEASKPNNSVFSNSKTNTQISSSRKQDLHCRLADIVVGLDLVEFIPTFTENKINYEDLLLLSKEDMKEIGLPIYARNRIAAFQSYLKKGRTISTSSRDLLQDILRSIYNPAFIDLIENSNTAHKLSDSLSKENVRAKEVDENVPVSEDGRESREQTKEVQEVKYVPGYMQRHSEKHKESLNRYKAELDSMLEALYKR
eukprot:TRINITY_DN14004_c0_g1_i2.p1 TRINITY_DN14004_c0_g1~~TRINITY_DN14004_c0_g1_i2.p1  ORF type:complete len:309 (+),score=79.20 TRINITY_DN14004_c0_g1_i2:94-1020(+)